MSKFKKTKKIVAGILGVAMALSLATPAQAQSVEDLTAQINALLATISALQAQLASLSGDGSTSAPAGVCPYTWTANLTMGASGADVMKLQQFLNSSPDTSLASAGAGSPGNETEYFGSITKAGVVKFQDKHAADVLAPVGLSAGTGFVGPSTRAKLNSLCVSAPVVVPPPSPIGLPGIEDTTDTPSVPGTGLTVTKSLNQPANSLAPYLAARLPFTRVTVTAGTDGPVTINNFTVERMGLSDNDNFAGVVVIDDATGAQLGTSKTLNSNNQATVGASVTVPAGQSLTFTIAGNMGSLTTMGGNVGQVIQLAVVSVNTSATVSGTLPIVGASHTANSSLVLGTASLARGTSDPNTSSTKDIGDTGYTFQAIRVTAGSAENIRLKSMRWNQTGSAAGDDLGNVVIMVDDVEYPATLSADGKFYSASFGDGVVILKGLNKEIKIRADILGGSGRTIIFDIDKDTDLYVMGETYGYGIIPTAGTTATAEAASSQFTTGTPFYDGATVTVQGGTLTSVSRASEVPSQNISINAPGQPLGGFVVDVKGEPITLQSLEFGFAIVGGSLTGIAIDNISLYDENGSVVAGPVDGTAATALSGGQGSALFSDTITFPTGRHVYTIKGKPDSTFANDYTIQASTSPAQTWGTPTGDVTGNSLTLSNGTVSGNVMTIKAGSFVVSLSSSPSSQNVVAGVGGYTFSNVQWDATQSGEDVKLSSAKFLMTTTTGTSYPTNCFIWDGTTRLNNTAVNPTADTVAGAGSAFTFDNNLVLPKGTIKTTPIVCDVPGSATAPHTMSWDLDGTASTYTGTGLGSGNTINGTATAQSGGTMTVAAQGTLTVEKDSSSPSYTIASAGSTGVTLGVLKFRSTNEEIDVTKVGLQLSGVAASSSPSDVIKVTLWDGATKVGEAIFTGSNRFATSSLSGAFKVPKDGEKIMTVKGDLGLQGTSQAGTRGAFVLVDFDYADSTGTRGIGASSGATINHGSSADTAMDGVRVFRSFPTLAKIDLTSALANGERALLRFTITADSKGSIGVGKLTARISTTTANVTGVNIYAYTDSAFSTPVSGLTSTGQLLAANLTGINSDTDLNFYPQTVGSVNTTVQIPAGATRYFEVRGTVAASGAGASVTTQLQGDAVYISSASLLDPIASLDGATHDDFLWSPNSTTTSSLLTNDWTNGYGVVGLPAANMNSQTLSP